MTWTGIGGLAGDKHPRSHGAGIPDRLSNCNPSLEGVKLREQRQASREVPGCQPHSNGSGTDALDEGGNRV